MKILVTGASSIIAEAILEVLETNTDFELVGISSKSIINQEIEKTKYHQINTLDFKSLRKVILEEKPDVIINTVGLHQIEDCNLDKKLAWTLNVDYVEQLVSVSKILNTWLISFSTEYVFDGKTGNYNEKVTPNPANYLGKSKLAAENLILASKIRSTIIRIPFIYGISVNGKSDFVQKIVNKLSKDEIVRVPKNFFTNPILSDDIGWGLLKILDRKYYSIIHFGGHTYLDLFQFAIKIAKIFNLEQLIKPEPAAKVSKFGLDSSFAEMLLDIKFSTLTEGLVTYKFLIEDESPFEKFFE